MPDLPAWVSAEGLHRLWPRLAARLERQGLELHGRVVLERLDRAERHAVGDLLGRALTADRVQIDLADLDQRLQARTGAGLLAVTADRVGRRLVDAPGSRADRDQRRAAPFRAAQRWLAEHCQLSGEPWLDPWLQALRRDGVLARASDPTATLLGALRVLDELTSPGHRACSRTDLAARVLHDSHALDDGSRLAALVLRALALRADAPAPTDAAGRRELWAGHDVAADLVSTTCLTLGLPVLGDGPVARRWRDSARTGDPVHLTWWDLRLDQLTVAAYRPVLVCENPRVLEAVAQRYAGTHPVVCTSGRPALVVVQVLRRLAACGVPLLYHGDFDWPGIAIADQVLDLVGARPWRMSAPDYLAAAAGVPLTGSPVEPSWDAELGAAMRHRGLSVHEEAVLDVVLDALPGAGRTSSEPT